MWIVVCTEIMYSKPITPILNLAPSIQPLLFKPFYSTPLYSTPFYNPAPPTKPIL